MVVLVVVMFGIGTNSPSEKLHISGSGAGQNTLRINSSTTAISFNNHSEFIGYIGNDSGKLFINAGGTQDTLLLQTGGTTNLVLDGGSVGIGTDNPSPDKLRVHKDGLNQILQRWGGRLGSTAGQRFMELYTPATDNMNDYFKFQTGNAIKFRIDTKNALCINSSGLVGIGTDTPSHELDIESSSPVIEMKDNDAGDSRFQIAQRGSQTRKSSFYKYWKSRYRN